MKIKTPESDISLKNKSRSILLTIRDDKPFLSHMLISLGKFDLTLNAEVGWSKKGEIKPWNISDPRYLDWFGSACELENYILDLNLLSDGNAGPFFLEKTINLISKNTVYSEVDLEEIVKIETEEIMGKIFEKFKYFAVPYLTSIALKKKLLRSFLRWRAICRGWPVR